MWNTIRFLLLELRAFCRKPEVLERGPRWLLKKATTEWHYERKKTTEIEFILSLTGASREDVLRYWEESKSKDLPWPLLYVIARVSKPNIVVETGVETGRSSFSILQALADNGQGLLYSIELGGGKTFESDGLTFNALSDDKVGSLVPAGLRNRWYLVFGDAREEVLPLLRELGAIDIFLHDSLHTDQHTLFEFQSAWPFLRETGYLLADDIGSSFREFACQVNKAYICTNLPYDHQYIGLDAPPRSGISRFGGVRK